MSIFDKQQNKVGKFKKLTKGKSKEEIRSMEEALLKPTPLQEYGGALPKNKSELSSRKCLIVFRDTYQKELIGELLSIRESVNHAVYITNINLLENIALDVRNKKAIVHNDKLVYKREEVDTKPVKEVFKPLTKEQLKELPKKKRKKYKKLLKTMDVASMQILQDKYFASLVGAECDSISEEKPK